MGAIAGRVLILPKGDYESETTYEFLDLVNYDGASWLAKKASQGIEPNDANAEFWQKFGSAVAVATEETAGIVRPDGESIVLGEGGLIIVTDSPKLGGKSAEEYALQTDLEGFAPVVVVDTKPTAGEDAPYPDGTFVYPRK